MGGKPNDRPKKKKNIELVPEIFVIIGKEKFPKPGLETYFSDTPTKREKKSSQCTCNTVMETFCSCNKVCTCAPVRNCLCHGHSLCACDGHVKRSKRSSGGGYGGSSCRCAPVH